MIEPTSASPEPTQLAPDSPAPSQQPGQAGREARNPNLGAGAARDILGGDLEAARRRLLAQTAALRPVVPAHAAAFLETAAETLATMRCRIAVIGQVKAGKSSFVNALMRRPDFLPTDINPWTTAITRLNFIDAAAEPGPAMRFRFFDAEEWDRLQNGSGYIRELTERLVPGFETELLRRNVEAIRKRAQARIGDDISALLGQTHEYPKYSQEILAKYICAGSPPEGVASEDADQAIYSDIIHSADINFPRPENQLPTVLIDTPGTNDPFMIRDEITRRALEQADVYVVVIMARQALSNADVALLRILRGLNKERIIVFINRIDELGDVATMTPRVIEHVRSGLQREFPGSDIPVLAGSALWANEEFRAAQARGTSAAAAKEPRSTTRGDSASPRSGLPVLFDVLNQTVIRARPGHLIRQVAVSLKELADLAAADLDQERARERAALTAGAAPKPTFDQAAYEALRDEIAEEARRSERLLEALAELLDDLEARFSDVLDSACDGLDESLRGELLRYRDRECERLMDVLARGASVGRWRAETADIRRAFEADVMRHYAAAARHFEFLTTAVCAQLEKLLNEWAPDTTASVPDQTAPLRHEPPAVTALGQFLVLDLSEPFWRRWLMAHQPATERVEQLDRLIRDEFGGVVDGLVHALDARLAELRAQFDMRLSVYHAMIVAAVEKRSQRAMERLRELERTRDAWAEDEARRTTHADRSSRLDAEARKLAAIRADLARTVEEWTKRCEPAAAPLAEPERAGG